MRWNNSELGRWKEKEESNDCLFWAAIYSLFASNYLTNISWDTSHFVVYNRISYMISSVSLSLTFTSLPVLLPPLDCKLSKGRCHVYFIYCFILTTIVIKCLAHNKCSIRFYWMNEWMEKGEVERKEGSDCQEGKWVILSHPILDNRPSFLGWFFTLIYPQCPQMQAQCSTLDEWESLLKAYFNFKGSYFHSLLICLLDNLGKNLSTFDS